MDCVISPRIATVTATTILNPSISQTPFLTRSDNSTLPKNVQFTHGNGFIKNQNNSLNSKKEESQTDHWYCSNFIQNIQEELNHQHSIILAATTTKQLLTGKQFQELTSCRGAALDLVEEKNTINIKEKSTNDIRNTCFNSNNNSSLPTMTFNTLSTSTSVPSLQTMDSIQQNAEEVRQIQQQEQLSQLLLPMHDPLDSVNLFDEIENNLSCNKIFDTRVSPSNLLKLNEDERSFNFESLLELTNDNCSDIKTESTMMDNMIPTDDYDIKLQSCNNPAVIEGQQQQLQLRETTPYNYNENNLKIDEWNNDNNNKNHNIDINSNIQQENLIINQYISGGNKRKIETETDNNQLAKKNCLDLKVNIGLTANNSEGLNTPQIIKDLWDLLYETTPDLSLERSPNQNIEELSTSSSLLDVDNETLCQINCINNENNPANRNSSRFQFNDSTSSNWSLQSPPSNIKYENPSSVASVLLPTSDEYNGSSGPSTPSSRSTSTPLSSCSAQEKRRGRPRVLHPPQLPAEKLNSLPAEEKRRKSRAKNNVASQASRDKKNQKYRAAEEELKKKIEENKKLIEEKNYLIELEKKLEFFLKTKLAEKNV